MRSAACNARAAFNVMCVTARGSRCAAGFTRFVTPEGVGAPTLSINGQRLWRIGRKFRGVRSGFARWMRQWRIFDRGSWHRCGAFDLLGIMGEPGRHYRRMEQQLFRAGIPVILDVCSRCARALGGAHWSHWSERRGALPHSKPMAARHSGVGGINLRVRVSHCAITNFPSQQICAESSMRSCVIRPILPS